MGNDDYPKQIGNMTGQKEMRMKFSFPRDDNFTNCEQHWNTLGCHRHFSLSRVDAEQFQALQEGAATEGNNVSSI